MSTNNAARAPRFYPALYALVRGVVLSLLRLRLRLDTLEGAAALHGASIICPNHPSYFDFFVVSAACQRRVRFVMYYKYFQIPLLRSIFKRCGVIPIASRSESRAIYEAAFDAMTEAIAAGEPLCLFPEGEVNADGLGPIKGGVIKLARATGARVTPMRISYERAARRFGRRGARAVVGDPIESAEVTAESIGAALSA